MGTVSLTLSPANQFLQPRIFGIVPSIVRLSLSLRQISSFNLRAPSRASAPSSLTLSPANQFFQRDRHPKGVRECLMLSLSLRQISSFNQADLRHRAVHRPTLTLSPANQFFQQGYRDALLLSLSLRQISSFNGQPSLIHSINQLRDALRALRLNRCGNHFVFPQFHPKRLISVMRALTGPHGSIGALA